MNPRINIKKIRLNSEKNIVIRRNNQELEKRNLDLQIIRLVHWTPRFTFVLSLALMIFTSFRPAVEDSFIMVFTLLSTSLLAVFGTLSGWRVTLNKFIQTHQIRINTIDEVVGHILYCSYLSILGTLVSILAKFFPTNSENFMNIFQNYRNNLFTNSSEILGLILVSSLIFIFCKIFILFTISITQLINAYEGITNV